MQEESVSFASGDGTPLVGSLCLPGQPTKNLALLCHGITVDREEGGVFTELARVLAAFGIASLRFDFRGHGKSGGSFEKMTVAGEIMDLKAALEQAAARGFSSIGLIGASFAGGPVSYVAAQRPVGVKALILWNAVLEYSFGLFAKRQREGMEIGGKLYRLSPSLLSGLPDPVPGRELLRASLPSLFIHGDRDELVPYEISVKYSNLMPDAALVTLAGAGHGFHDSENCRKACAAAVEFLSSQL